MHPKYHETIAKLKMWSRREENIRGTILLGSQVRAAFAGDEWSDLDVFLLAKNPQALFQNDDWLAEFGDVVCVTYEKVNLDWISLIWSIKRVLFTDNRTLDFSIMPSDRMDDVLSINAEIHVHGYDVIYDTQPPEIRAKIETTLTTVKEEPPTIPTEDILRQTVDDLLFQLIWACKKIKRNELWTAVSGINQQISNRLLQLIEFHTASRANTVGRIRYEGRFLEHRTRQEILDQLPRCFAKYDAADAIQTVGHLIDLATELAQAICAANHYPFNAAQFAMIRKLYGEMFGNERCQQLAEAAQRMLHDYQANSELTSFTALDG